MQHEQAVCSRQVRLLSPHEYLWRTIIFILSPLPGSYSSASEVAPWQKLWQAALVRRGGELPSFALEARPETRDVLYLRQPDAEEARKLVQAQPRNARARFALAKSLLAIGKTAPARESLLLAIRLRPDWNEPYLALGRLALQERKYAEAATRFSTAIKLAPRSIASRMGLAEVRVTQNRKDEARALYESVLADDPNSPTAMNNLAFLYSSDDRDLSRATEMARRALAADPTNAAMLDTLGWVLTRSGRVGEGVPPLREAVRRAPENALIQSHLGQALILNNQKTEGAAYLRNALDGRLPAKDKAQAQAALSKAGG